MALRAGGRRDARLHRLGVARDEAGGFGTAGGLPPAEHAYSRFHVRWYPASIVFLAFVVYPVSYGLWLARHPDSYTRLFADPIFIRTVVNTVIFLLVAVNLKFLLALWMSGFFVHERPWIRWMSVLFLLPWAVPVLRAEPLRCRPRPGCSRQRRPPPSSCSA